MRFARCVRLSTTSQAIGVTAAGGTELCLGVMSLLSWDSSNTSCVLSSSSSSYKRSPPASPASLSAAAAATAAAALLLITASSASLSALRARTISLAVEAAVRDSMYVLNLTISRSRYSDLRCQLDMAL